MALYAIGDLHLSFQVEMSQEHFGSVWKNHEQKVKTACEALVDQDDTLVLVGDHSWGHKLPECEEDLQFISDLPGHKVLIRGNHDMFWDAKKTQRLNDLYAGKLFFLQDNYYPYGDVALVGTKGYTYEGLDTPEHAAKLVDREAARLQKSFDAATADGFTKFIMFLHYPPTNIMERTSVFTRMADRYRVYQVVYAHCHGKARFHDSIQGRFHGIEYSLVSGDYLNFVPKRLM